MFTDMNDIQELWSFVSNNMRLGIAQPHVLFPVFAQEKDLTFEAKPLTSQPVAVSESGMQVFYRNEVTTTPRVSLVLLDWSCRESLHIFRYLASQAVPRSAFEVVWIEYYTRRHDKLDLVFKECDNAKQHPPADLWIGMGMPREVCYHKHLMYNIGLLASRGDIVVFMDSDVMMTPTFIGSIINEFTPGRRLVLHLDEVRNTDRRFYPFNNPPISALLGKGVLNWRNGRTIGLDGANGDPLHWCNYGACMCAPRNELIGIGGADEHIDYLGHICGPYEMTFRLRNNGAQEHWHPKEYLYHTWHPGTDGVGNRFGPSDGRNMSSTALSVISSRRVLPLDENPLVQKLRTSQPIDMSDPNWWMNEVIRNEKRLQWRN